MRAVALIMHKNRKTKIKNAPFRECGSTHCGQVKNKNTATAAAPAIYEGQKQIPVRVSVSPSLYHSETQVHLSICQSESGTAPPSVRSTKQPEKQKTPVAGTVAPACLSHKNRAEP